MQLRILTILAAAAATVSAMPATTPVVTTAVSSQHKSIVETIATTSTKKTKPHGKPKAPKMKTVNTIDIDLNKCGACFSAVTQTISSCEPVLNGFTGWFHIPQCIGQIVNDFGALQDDCIPCLQSFID